MRAVGCAHALSGNNLLQTMEILQTQDALIRNPQVENVLGKLTGGIGVDPALRP